MRIEGLLRTQIVVPVLVALVLGGPSTSAGESEVADGIDVYFRDADLGALSSQSRTEYPDTDPGEADKLERAFADAPPQIPHSVEDMLPIMAGDNECLTCHDPDEATDEDVPLPDSHFTRARIGEGSSQMRSVVTGYEKVEDLAGTRYNCSMCHAPQARNVKTPKNLLGRAN